MYIVALAWIYVVLMMAVAEATNSNGTVLGAIMTFVLYGVLPLSILIYLMRAPQRARAAKAARAIENTAPGVGAAEPASRPAEEGNPDKRSPDKP